MSKKQSSTGGWIAAGVVLVLVVAGGVYFVRKGAQAPAPTSASSSTSSDTGAASEAVQHPIEKVGTGPASASTAPLPALDDSDTSVVSALEALAGGDGLSSLLVRQQVVQRMVATIDALPRRGLSAFMLPVHTPEGAFVTDNANDTTTIGAGNAERYAPYMRIVQDADPDQLVAWYVHAYPLFQQAYRQLGYPKGYFNDRLIVVIDNLLAAPDLTQPPSLVLSKGYYRYADPTLESLSAGQRMMIRVGPDNEAKLKAKLRMIRAKLVGQNLKPAAAPAVAASAG